MARHFKPVRFFVLMGIAAFLVCGVTAFFTQRAEHGRNREERLAYVIGEKEGAQAANAGGILPTAAGLQIVAQQHFAEQGSGERMAWKDAFVKGYSSGFRKAHSGH